VGYRIRGFGALRSALHFAESVCLGVWLNLYLPIQAKELGSTTREAATRIFSNSSGSYSSNVNLAVENSSWSDESQLQEMYLKRKSFAFNSDRWAPMICNGVFGEPLQLVCAPQAFSRHTLCCTQHLSRHLYPWLSSTRHKR